MISVYKNKTPDRVQLSRASINRQYKGKPTMINEELYTFSALNADIQIDAVDYQHG